MKSIGCLLVGLRLLSLSVWGAESEFVPPENIDYRVEDVWSEGVRLSAEIFSPGDNRAEKHPTIVMCHGWGGEARHLRSDAVLFAQNGFLVVTFDYRG